MMILVKSYLCNPNKIITDLSQLKANPEDFLIDIDDDRAIQKIKDAIDLDYMNGVIYIQHGDQVIFDYGMWDLIDQLWSYIITVIEKYKEQGIGSSYLPDQPIRFELQKTRGNKLVFTLQGTQEKEWLFSESQFLNALLEGANHFFSKLKKLSLIDDESCMYELNRIKKLKEQ